MSITSEKLIESGSLAPVEKAKVRRHFNSMHNALLEKDEELKEAMTII